MNLQRLNHSISMQPASMGTKARFKPEGNKASQNSLASAPQFEGIPSRKLVLRGLLGLGLVLGTGVAVTNSCRNPDAPIGDVSTLQAGKKFLISANGKVTNLTGELVALTTGEGTARRASDNTLLGETNAKGVIFQGPFLPTPIGKIDADGTVRSYLGNEVLGKVNGNFTLQQKGAIALATLFKQG